MPYLVKWRTPGCGCTELAFYRKEDAIAHARATIDGGGEDVEVIEDGTPVPRSAYAPAESHQSENAERDQARRSDER